MHMCFDADALAEELATLTEAVRPFGCTKSRASDGGTCDDCPGVEALGQYSDARWWCWQVWPPGRPRCVVPPLGATGCALGLLLRFQVNHVLSDELLGCVRDSVTCCVCW